MNDSVLVVAPLTTARSLTVNSSGKSPVMDAPAASAFSVPMSVGQQRFTLARNGQNVRAAVDLKDIVNTCICSLYSFSAFTGAGKFFSDSTFFQYVYECSFSYSQVTPTFVELLEPAGAASLFQGLHVATCQPTPSLATAAHTPVSAVICQQYPNLSQLAQSQPLDLQARHLQDQTLAVNYHTTAAITGSTGSCTITASEQIRPTSCLPSGCVWVGQAGQATPDQCDGH
jgi:hypothetical protein